MHSILNTENYPQSAVSLLYSNAIGIYVYEHIAYICIQNTVCRYADIFSNKNFSAVFFSISFEITFSFSIFFFLKQNKNISFFFSLQRFGRTI